MKKSTYFCLFILGFIFSGCASVQEKCQSYGFMPGTVEFANCNMVESQRQQDDYGRFMDGVREDRRHSEQMDALRQHNSYQPTYQQPSVHCTTRRTGNYSTMDCY